MKNRNITHSDNWSTPKWLYDQLDAEFHFDFDPCPLCTGEITPDKDGLLIEWGGGKLYKSAVFQKVKRSLYKTGLFRKPERKNLRYAFAG